MCLRGGGGGGGGGVGISSSPSVFTVENHLLHTIFVLYFNLFFLLFIYFYWGEGHTFFFGQFAPITTPCHDWGRGT